MLGVSDFAKKTKTQSEIFSVIYKVDFPLGVIRVSDMSVISNIFE